MTTFTISIDEKSKEGKALIAKLKSSSSVIGWKKKKSLARRKVRYAIDDKDDKALGMVMESVETGKLVDKKTVMKALRSVK